jgi:hypothetical protein
MHYHDQLIIEEVIFKKIRGSNIKKITFLRLLTNINLDYQTQEYELVINRLIKNGKLIEKDEFIRYKDSEDFTKLFVEHNGVRGIWAYKT